MGKHIIIAGRMDSGKTTVERELTARGYRRIVTYTTRPRRRDETQDVDYHFISEENELFARFEKVHHYDYRIPVGKEDSEGKVLEEVLALIGST